MGQFSGDQMQAYPKKLWASSAHKLRVVLCAVGGEERDDNTTTAS